MANDYLVYKWELWFTMFDSKNMGKVYRKDAKEDEELFAKLSHLSEERKKEVMKIADEVWERIVFQGRAGPVTKQEFIDTHKKEYREDSEKFRKEMEECYTKLFDTFDISREGSVTFEEFIHGFKAIHHENIIIEKVYFDSFGPVDGKVPCKKLVDSWVHFLTCDDSTQRDLVKVALECGL